jgi:DNA invertase Pin-like site-specific DNA recombinase
VASAAPRTGGRHSTSWSRTKGAGASTCWCVGGSTGWAETNDLILLLDELQAVGVAFVSLAECIDATTPGGRVQLHVLGAIAEFERARIAERIRAGLARAKAQGTKLGRPVATPPLEQLQAVAGRSAQAAADTLGVSRSTLKRWRKQVQQSSPSTT